MDQLALERDRESTFSGLLHEAVSGARVKRWRMRQALLLASLAMLAAVGGVAVSGEATLDDLGRAQTKPSGLVDMLGPNSETGRVGCDCAPEYAARAATARAAELPAPRD